MPHPLIVNHCLCCGAVAYQDQELCEFCSGEAYFLTYLHLTPESEQVRQ